jgi:hypothetical protein
MDRLGSGLERRLPATRQEIAVTKYLFLYRGPDQQPDVQPSPEEIQAMFAQWDVWKNKFKNNVVDVGDGLKPGGRVWKGNKVTDGPFVEAKEIMAGYSIIQAGNYDEATKVAAECPITFMPGMSIEIREMAGF